MTGQQAHIPGTEPTPPEIERARHNLRRDHIRHRLTNASGRIARQGESMWGADDAKCAELERFADRIEVALEQLGRTLEEMRTP